MGNDMIGNTAVKNEHTPTASLNAPSEGSHVLQLTPAPRAEAPAKAPHGPKRHCLAVTFAAEKNLDGAVRRLLQSVGVQHISVRTVDGDEMAVSRYCWPSREGNEAVLEQRLMEFKQHFDVECSMALSARPKIAIMVSKSDHCLTEILHKVRSGALYCEVAVIVSNHISCRALALAHGIPFYHIEISASNKTLAEEMQLDLLASHDVELVVLARYMQILSPQFIEGFDGPIINIHHSLLPAFIGADPYQRAYDRGVRIIGATAHYVTPVLDEGPIVDQDVTRVGWNDAVEDFRLKGADVERRVLVRAIRSHLERRVIRSGDRCIHLGD